MCIFCIFKTFSPLRDGKARTGRNFVRPALEIIAVILIIILIICLASSGVNFINVLWAAFMVVDPNNIKRYWQLNWNFMLLGFLCVKAVCRTLMKLTAGVNFINVLRAAFTSADPESANVAVKDYQLDRLFCSFGICALKVAHRTLMKLNPGLDFVHFV